MSYRYNTIDIIVGVGLCAIVFGALLFFVAANGTYEVVLSQAFQLEHPTDTEVSRAALQPALGQAIVDQAIFERHADHAIAQSVSEWNRATLASHEFESRPGGPFGAVMRQAATVPADHMARVQGIMGRAIVNYTKRGTRNGLLSADQHQSAYNTAMIRAIEARGQRLHQEFTSTWQATLGRSIVDSIQRYRKDAGAIQERLGSALLQVVAAQTKTEEGWATQQEQLAGLIVAAVRSETPADPITLPATIASRSEGRAASHSEAVSWPEVPMGYLIVAGFVLVVVFFGGLSMAARGREAKALAQMRLDADRWVYRMAA